MGTLSQGATGIAGFSVDNTGSGPAATVTVNVSLPVGVSLLAGGTLGRASLDRSSPGGWTCAPAGGGATCTHGLLASCAPPARATGPNKLSGVALKQHGRGIHAVRAAGRAHARYDSVWMGYRGCCETHYYGTALI